MRQIETSRTIVFDAPRRARAFVEALVADNLDLGRPESVELIFTGKHERRGRATQAAAGLQDDGGHPRHRGDHQRVLQALPSQAVPQGRAGATDRDGRQLPNDLGCPAAFTIWTSCRSRPVT